MVILDWMEDQLVNDITMTSSHHYDIITHREHLVLEVKLEGLVIQVHLVTRDHLDLMDPKDSKVMPALEAQLEQKASVDQMENLLVALVTVEQ